MDRNVHADLPFSEDAFIDADITGAINVDIKEVLYNTTEYWDSHPEIIAAKGIIYIYSDYKIIDNKTIPGIKVGDGSSYLIDIPFSDIEIELKADKATTYTKTEVNFALSSKADKANTYTKTEVDTALNDKADKNTTYTKTEVDTALNDKADKINTYTKSQVDAALNLKADTADVTASLALKADKATTYTKTEVDTDLATKADKADTYTKTQVDTALSAKANTADVTASLALKADKADTYTKAQVDNIISNLPEPMIFKGTLGVNGTISDLPVASSDNDGFTYKVITDGTYQGIAAKVGDVFTSNGAEWVLIPSGDDVEDTWRTIKVNGTEVLNSTISSGSVDFVEGNNIEIVFNSTGNAILFKTKNIYTKAEVDTALGNKADKADTYTKSQVDTALAGKSNVAVAPIVTRGVDIATVTVDGTPTTIKAPAQVSEIDDTSTALDKTWSASKLNGLLILDVTNVGV